MKWRRWAANWRLTNSNLPFSFFPSFLLSFFPSCLLSFFPAFLLFSFTVSFFLYFLLSCLFYGVLWCSACVVLINISMFCGVHQTLTTIVELQRQQLSAVHMLDWIGCHRNTPIYRIDSTCSTCIYIYPAQPSSCVFDPTLEGQTEKKRTFLPAPEPVTDKFGLQVHLRPLWADCEYNITSSTTSSMAALLVVNSSPNIHQKLIRHWMAEALSSWGVNWKPIQVAFHI